MSTSNKNSIKLIHRYYSISSKISQINSWVWSKVPILYDAYMILSCRVFSPIDQWLINVVTWMDDHIP